MKELPWEIGSDTFDRWASYAMDRLDEQADDVSRVHNADLIRGVIRSAKPVVDGLEEMPEGHFLEHVILEAEKRFVADSEDYDDPELLPIDPRQKANYRIGVALKDAAYDLSARKEERA